MASAAELGGAARRAHLAVIGDPATVQAFGALGVEAVPVLDDEAARHAVAQRLSPQYGALFVTEAVYRAAEEHIAAAADEPVPAVTVIPHAGGPAGVGEARLKEIIVKAVGSELVTREEGGHDGARREHGRRDGTPDGTADNAQG